MDRNLVLLNRNIARLRRDVRLQAFEIEQLIGADLDCAPAAQRLMRAQADLVLYIEKRERLMAQRTSTCYSACNFGSDSLLMQFEGCLAL
jgi:hypothetical protein